MHPTRSIPSAIAISALIAAGLATAVAAPVAAAERTATLVGNLQDEISSCADWTPDCAPTDLTQVGTTPIYERIFEVPAGSYEFKVAINHDWEESYGGPSGNIPLVLAGPARLKVSYNDENHKIGVTPMDMAGPVTPADNPEASHVTTGAIQRGDIAALACSSASPIARSSVIRVSAVGATALTVTP